MHNAIRPFDGMTGELVQNATLDALRMAHMNFAREEYDRLERLILQQILPVLGGRASPASEELCRHLEQVRTFSGNFCWQHRCRRRCARCSGGAAMKYFIERATGVNYYFVLNERRPVFPFGVCGPFAKRREAKKAASKLRKHFPGCDLGVHLGWFSDRPPSDLLVRARADARSRLQAMLGMNLIERSLPRQQ